MQICWQDAYEYLEQEPAPMTNSPPIANQIALKETPWLELMGDHLALVVINLVREYCNDDAKCVLFPTLRALSNYHCNWIAENTKGENLSLLCHSQWYLVTNYKHRIEYVKIEVSPPEPPRRDMHLGSMHGNMIAARSYHPTRDYFLRYTSRWEIICGNWTPLLSTGVLACIDQSSFYFVCASYVCRFDGSGWIFEKNLPPRITITAAVVYCSTLYVFGNQQQLLRLDPVEGWITCAIMRFTREKPLMFVYEDFIYVCGGIINGLENDATMECYDPQKDKWVNGFGRFVLWSKQESQPIVICDGQQALYYHK